MSPRISPNKTWVGLIGGMLLAAVVASVFALIFGWRDVSSIALAGAIVALIAQLGDLYESSVKRRFHAKDSGELIPGHGGILDRVDGLISAAPVVALYLSFLQLTS
jgi:phosphatidate cytidylyltransferase